MRLASKIIVSVAIAMALAACSRAIYEDVSHEAMYSHLIGKEFRTRQKLLVYGITDDQNYRPPVDYYLIMGPPGIGGPEVLQRNVLDVGAIVKVVRVEHCTNCFGQHNDRFEVAVRADFLHTGKPVFVKGIGEELEADRSGGIILSGRFFEPVSN